MGSSRYDEGSQGEATNYGYKLMQVKQTISTNCQHPDCQHPVSIRFLIRSVALFYRLLYQKICQLTERTNNKRAKEKSGKEDKKTKQKTSKFANDEHCNEMNKKRRTLRPPLLCAVVVHSTFTRKARNLLLLSYLASSRLIYIYEAIKRSIRLFQVLPNRSLYGLWPVRRFAE
jgi:hypothetical protein